MDRREFIKQSMVSYGCSAGLLNDRDIISPIGVAMLPSPYTVEDTINRLVVYLQGNGATLYARIDQQAEVQKAGQQIPPLQFILFGNPQSGGPIMAQSALSALDLPLKIIAWEDDQKKVWLAYNEANYIRKRYTLTEKLVAPLKLDLLIKQGLKP